MDIATGNLRAPRSSEALAISPKRKKYCPLHLAPDCLLVMITSPTLWAHKEKCLVLRWTWSSLSLSSTLIIRYRHPISIQPSWQIIFQGLTLHHYLSPVYRSTSNVPINQRASTPPYRSFIDQICDSMLTVRVAFV